jgi:hypothetical protein
MFPNIGLPLTGMNGLFPPGPPPPMIPAGEYYPSGGAPWPTHYELKKVPCLGNCDHRLKYIPTMAVTTRETVFAQFTDIEEHSMYKSVQKHQSITAIPAYRCFSFEEIRLLDTNPQYLDYQKTYFGNQFGDKYGTTGLKNNGLRPTFQ